MNGADVDTSFGQPLRRMPEKDDGTRYALVVPVEARVAALRVSPRVREVLRPSVCVVNEGGLVEIEGGLMMDDDRLQAALRGLDPKALDSLRYFDL